MGDKRIEELSDKIAEKVTAKIGSTHCPLSQPKGLIGALRVLGMSSIWLARGFVTAVAISAAAGVGTAIAWAVEAVSALLK